MRPGILLVMGLIVALAAGGCARRYIITTTTGAKIVTPRKPKSVENKYVYKDANGQTVEISKLRVRVIEPYSEKAAGRQLSIPELQ